MLNIALQVSAWLAIYCTFAQRVQARTVRGGVGEAICTKNGNIAPDATRECCNGIDHNAYYSMFFGECWAQGGPWHKAIKYEEFARCCASRDDADSSSSNRHSLLRLGVEPDAIYLGPPETPNDSTGTKKLNGGGNGGTQDGTKDVAERIKPEWMKQQQKLKDDRKKNGQKGDEKALTEKP